MKRIFLLATCFVAVCAYAAFDPAAQAERLLREGIKSAQGEDEESGHWFMAVGSVLTGEMDREDALAAARLEARRAVAATLTSNIESLTVSERGKTDAGKYNRFMRNAANNIDETLRGVAIVKEAIRGDRAFAVAMFSERTADVMNALRQTKSTEKPGAVQATGEGKTLESAVQAACRNAIAQMGGVTMVGADLTNGATFQSRTYSDLQGAVSEYRVVSQEKTATGGVRVTIFAVIKQGPKASYGADLKSAGDPIFWITSSSDDAGILVSDFLTGKGLKTSLVQGTADYRVDATPRYRTVTHPITKKTGTQVTLSIVCWDSAGVQLFTLQNDPRRTTDYSETAESPILVERAFRQVQYKLYDRLNRAITDMTNNGRSVRLVFPDTKLHGQARLIERMTDVINDFIPSASAATFSWDPQNPNTAIIRLTLRGNPQDFLSLLRTKVPECPTAIEVSTNLILFNF